MCLNCGCMRAHDDMGKPGVNLTLDDIRRAAEANGMSVDQTLDAITRTAALDRSDHGTGYSDVKHPAPVPTASVTAQGRGRGHRPGRGSVQPTP